MPRGVYVRTEAHRRAISLGHLGKHPSLATRKKQSLAHLGKHHSPERIEKNRISHLRENLSPATRKKQSLAQLGEKNPNFGKPSNRLGKTWEEIYGVERAKECRRKNSGPNCHLYRDGKSNEPYGKDFDNVCRLYIRERDDFMCQFPGCGKLENGKAFCVHHIDHNKHNNNPWDLILICRSCHSKEAIMFKKNPDETMNMFEDVLRARHIIR